MIETKTGKLSACEVAAILDAIPGDVTFADAEGKIRYFNEPRERLFSRTPAILGTSVQSCHPEKSVPLVNRVLADLKAGIAERIDSHATVDGRPVEITYLAVRGQEGEYLGCLEFARAVPGAGGSKSGGSGTQA